MRPILRTIPGAATRGRGALVPGRYLFKLNLTGFNPDPAVNNGENYRALKQFLLAARG